MRPLTDTQRNLTANSSGSHEGTTPEEKSTASTAILPGGAQALSLTQYPLEAAIADTIYYNDLCSLDKGLENIEAALEIAKHPGLDELVAAQEIQNQLLSKQLDAVTLRDHIREAEIETTKATAIRGHRTDFGEVPIHESSMPPQKVTLTNG